MTPAMLVAGIWLLLASWFLGYPFTHAAVDAQRNETGVGIVVLLTAGARMVQPRGWLSDLITLALGVWLVVASFQIDYGGPAVTPEAARTNEVITGSVLIALAVVSLLALFRARRTTPEDGR